MEYPWFWVCVAASLIIAGVMLAIEQYRTSPTRKWKGLGNPQD